MSRMMNWFLSQMRLVDVETENDESGQVFFKIVQSYGDCKLVIDNYERKVTCIYQLEPLINTDAQGMMNYICGGLYALGGDVIEVGQNLFMTVNQAGKGK